MPTDSRSPAPSCLSRATGRRDTCAATGPDGRFRLPGVYREPAFVFVEQDGLAFEGHRIGAGEESVELRVRRDGDRVGLPLHTLPPVLSREEEKALARRLIGTHLSVLTGETGNEAYAMARALPRVDFERAWELVENHAVPHPAYDEILHLECARALAATSLQEAATIAETLKTPYMRSSFYRLASDALPKADRARRLDLLEKALVHARAETQVVRKLDELGMIGYRLLELGATERGTLVLREGQRLAESLPKPVAGQRGPGNAQGRGRFAPKLARIDAPAALALAEGFSEPRNNWFEGGVALALADRDPAGSERAFGRLTNKRLRDTMVVRAAGRMVVLDRERARRLIETLDRPSDQALALGAMAEFLAGTDPKATVMLVDEAYRRLEKLSREGGDQPRSDACVIAAHLLPTAERLDPELLRRGFWRAVALRPPRPAGGDPTGRYEDCRAPGRRPARYDRDVARQVLEPAAARARSLVEHDRGQRGHNLFAAAAAIDPNWAVALADRLPDDRPAAPLHPKATIRRVIADVLAYDGPERWEHLDSDYLYFTGDSKDQEW